MIKRTYIRMECVLIQHKVLESDCDGSHVNSQIQVSLNSGVFFSPSLLRGLPPGRLHACPIHHFLIHLHLPKVQAHFPTLSSVT